MYSEAGGGTVNRDDLLRLNMVGSASAKANTVRRTTIPFILMQTSKLERNTTPNPLGQVLVVKGDWTVGRPHQKGAGRR